MQMCIRAPRAEDYPALARIHNDQNEPDFHTTPDRLRDADARRAAASSHHRRLVLEADGEPGATLTWHPDFGDDARGDVRWTYPYVRRDRRGEGLDARLVRHALALDFGPVREVRTTLRADFVAATSFLETEGFCELYRSWGSHLDLTRFDPDRFDGAVDELARAGIRLVRYLDLAPDAELEARVIAFQRRVEEDAIAFEPVIPRRHDDLRSPHTLPETWTLALDKRDEIVGIASLVGPARDGMIECGFTGVARADRNRGIGTALAARTACIAQGLGFVDLNAAGAGTGTPILAVVRKLGFAVEPAWITYASPR